MGHDSIEYMQERLGQMGFGLIRIGGDYVSLAIASLGRQDTAENQPVLGTLFRVSAASGVSRLMDEIEQAARDEKVSLASKGVHQCLLTIHMDMPSVVHISRGEFLQTVAHIGIIWMPQCRLGY